MNFTADNYRNRTVTAMVSGLIALFALTLALATPARAHTDLVSSTPAAGDTVTAAPATIELTFSEPPLQEGSAIVVANEDGSPATSGAATLSGSTLSIPWPADLKPGKITLTWRIAADDGHVLTDEISFTYSPEVDPGAVIETATPSDAPSQPMVIATPANADSTESKDSTNTKIWGASTLLVTIGIYVVIRRRKVK